jgi:hypothetical protein
MWWMCAACVGAHTHLQIVISAPTGYDGANKYLQQVSGVLLAGHLRVSHWRAAAVLK